MRNWFPILAALAGCGSKEDSHPVAIAGPDHLITIGETVTLDGSASSDRDGRVKKWEWSLISSPADSHAIIEGKGAKTTLQSDAIGRYVVSLVVTDDAGNPSIPDIVEVVTTEPAERPVARLRATGALGPGLPVTLDGSLSSAPGESAIIRWDFSLLVAPDGSTATIEAGTEDEFAQFTPDVDGLWIAGLAVSDGELSSRVATIELPVGTEVNQTPIAFCGGDQDVAVDDLVRLDGSSSIDPEGASITYQWTLTRPDASTGVIINDTGPLAQFEADTLGTFEASLLVSDGVLDSDLCTALIEVVETVENQAPVADAGDDQIKTGPGEKVNLDGTASFDPEGESLVATWKLLSTPPTSGLTVEDVSGADTLTPQFTPDQEGTYILGLSVCDPGPLCADDGVTVFVGDTENQAPVASAGPDRATEVGVGAPLDGTESTDPDGDALTYAWRIQNRPAGSAALIEDSDQASASLSPDVEGDYLLQLEVSDGTATASDWVSVLAVAPGTNLAPACATTGDQTTDMGVAVTLDASDSYDPNGDPLSMGWSVVSGPSGVAPTFSDPGSAITSFTPILPGEYTVRVDVTDGSLACSEQLQVLVIDTTPNTPPSCDAGGDVTTELGEMATLNGSGTSDVDGDPLSITWAIVTAPAGSSAEIDDPSAMVATFTPDVAGIYEVSFEANDGEDICTEWIVVDVQVPVLNTPPDCDAGGDLTAELGATVALDATASTDADGDPLTYEWRITDRPTGSTSTIVDATSAVASFTPAVSGYFSIRVDVSDGTDTCRAEIALVVEHNSPPTCDAGGDLSGTQGEELTLDASATTDPDGDVLTVQWRIIERPESSTATIDAVTLKVTTFTPDLPGTYTVRFTADDGRETCADDIVLTIASTNTPPECDAGGDLSGLVAHEVTLDARGTSDPDGDALVYQWRIIERPEGSTATIDLVTIRLTTFTPDVEGAYLIRFTADDGEDTCAEDLTLTVAPNSPPTCDAGPDLTAEPDEEVSLDGRGTSDPDGDDLTYQWRIIERPDGSTATIDLVTIRLTTLTPDSEGTYTIRFTATDGTDGCQDDMVLTVSTTPNTPPDCDAGDDQTVSLGTEAILDASGSSDADGDILTYMWRIIERPSGSTATIDAVTLRITTFTADVGGAYTIRSIVDDGTDVCQDDTVLTVTGGSGGPGGPTADAGRDLILCDTGEVELSGVDSTGSGLSYSWSFVSVPDGSTATDADLLGGGTATPAFTPDAEGRYSIELTVNNSDGSDSDSVAVTLSADGSVAILHLDEGSGTLATDGSPAGNDATITNPQWTGGRFFGGHAFDGSSYMTIADSPSLDLTGDFTIDWWMSTEDRGSDWRAVLTKGAAYNYSVWTYQDDLYFYGVTTSGSYVFASGRTSTLGDGSWHHYAATVGGGEMTIYVDGVSLASEDLTEPLLTNSAALHIGRPAYSSTSDMFVGSIDELTIREGLMTASEVAIMADADTQFCTGDEDALSPDANITEPSFSASTEIGYIKIVGTAEDQSAIASVSVNGASAVSTSDNFSTWVAYVPLTEGTNSLVVRVEDVAGNVNSDADDVLVDYNDTCGDDTMLLLAFDEDGGTGAIDWGPYGSDGTESGVSRVIGQYGNALSVEGSGSVTVPHSPVLEGGDAISMEMWILRDGPTTDLEVLAAKGDPSTYGMALYTDMLVFGFDDDAGTEWATITTGVTDGSWHHVVGVFDGGELSIFVDGALSSSIPTFGALPATNSQALTIGSFYDVGGALNGAIDQLRLYDGALSPSEVVDLYTSDEACPLGENLALGSIASASSTLNPLFSADNTIDDDTRESEELHYTMWLGENDGAAWVELDFSDIVGVLRVRWANTHNRSYMNRATTDYRIESSVTGAFGDEATTIATGTAGLESDLFFHTEESSPVAARYLRFYADGFDGLGPGLNEIQVYGLE